MKNRFGIKLLVVCLCLVLPLLMVAASSAAPEATSRFWLAGYDPPHFAVQARLVESQTDVTIKFDGIGFSIGFSGFQLCQPGPLSTDEMVILEQALDYAVRTARALPE